MGVAAKATLKIGAVIAAAVFGTLILPSSIHPGCTGPQCDIHASSSSGAVDVASGIDWVTRAAFKAGVAAGTRDVRRKHEHLQSGSDAPSVSMLAVSTASKCAAQAATALASPPPSASHAHGRFMAEGATSTPSYNNCYVVTLQRDAVRVEHIRNLTSTDLRGGHIVWAIDGRNVSDKQVDTWQQEGYLAKRLSGLMDPTKVVGKPKIACLMSHVRLWEQLVCDPSPDAFYLILEDDVYVAADFHERYRGVLAELVGLSWDWVYLAIHPTWSHGNRLTIPGKSLINHAPRMVGNAGYLLSKRGAQKLLDNLLPCSLAKDQAVRILVQNKVLEAYIVKQALIEVKGQQGRGFKGSLNHDPSRIFKSNIWDK